MDVNIKQNEILTSDFFESFFNHSLELFCICNLEGYFIKLNPKWTEVLGFNLEELSATPFIDFVHPDDVEMTRLEFAKILKGEETHSFINRCRTKDSSYKWLEWNSHLLTKEKLVIASAREISDRVILGEKFKENEYKLNLLIKYSNSAMALLDLDLNFIFVSQKWIREVKRPEKDLIGKNVYDVFPQIKAQNKWPPIVEKCLNGYREKKYQDKIMDRHGNASWFNWEMRPWYDKNDQIVGIYMMIENVTEMVKSHMKLINSERMLQESQKIAKLGSWEFDPYTREVIWNDEMYEILGLDKKDHDGKIDILFELAHPDDRERFIRTVNQSSIEKTTVPIEYRSITPSGELKYISARGGSILDEDDKVVKFYGTYQDITDLKLTEQVILNSERKFRAILESGPDAFIIINNEGLIDLANKKAENLFGYSKEAIKNQKLEVFLRENYESGPSCLKKYFNVDPSADNGTIELVGINREGKKFPVEVSINPLETEFGFYFNMAIRDITERKNAEVALQTKTEQLEIKNKELEQFAYVASHDLQEPLRTISSFVELIEKDYKTKLDASGDQYIKFIIDASERMRVLIKSLLDYSRIGRSQEYKMVDCNAVVKTVIKDLSTSILIADAKINVEKLPVVVGHEYEIKLLVQNLISNAIKFRKQELAPEISVQAEKEEGFWKFAIRDNGIGIDKKHREKIFIIFQRLHNRNSYEGTGIGLAHCKKIVELHGGKIWVVSEPGKGSIFYFTIKV